MMDNMIKKHVNEIKEDLIKWRRDFHKYAEVGHTEFRTTSIIASYLLNLGYEIKLGTEIFKKESMLGLPSDEQLNMFMQRAIDDGADPVLVEKMNGGMTGVVAKIGKGKPVIALRMDIDAMPITECYEKGYRPFDNNYSSVHKDACHSCGHDGHAALGMGVAYVLSKMKDNIKGTIKLIFQPAEEGVRGAKPMVDAMVVDDVDVLFGGHLYNNHDTGTIIYDVCNFAATYKLDVDFIGSTSHAGGMPEGGNNALLAAATAILNLHALPRHSEGLSRINVGKVNAGIARNSICPEATLIMEIRGANSTINDAMYQKAETIIKSSAQMHGCNYEIRKMGHAETATDSPRLIDYMKKRLNSMEGINTKLAKKKGGGSEDFCTMMTRVQLNGGLAASMGIGSSLNSITQYQEKYKDMKSIAHSKYFDFDENALHVAVRVYVDLLLHYTNC